MKLANYHPPTQQEFPAVPPPLFEALRTTFRQVDDLTGAAQGELSLVGNLNTEMVEISARHGVAYDVALSTLSGQALGGFVVYAQGMPHPALFLEIVDEGKIRVALTWGTDPGKEVFTRILVIGA